MAITFGGGITIGGGISVGQPTTPPGPTPSTTFFPMSNTATDPTSPFWQGNNPGYTFTPNVGITTSTPMTDARYMVAYNSTFNDPDVSTWDTSSITNMGNMFRNATAFNQNLNSWNISNVTDIGSMFRSATAFNQNLNSWNTSNVINLTSTFDTATSFNGNISAWNTANVTTMTNTFNSAAIFNCGQASGVAHDLMQRTATTGWKVENVTDMNQTFQGAAAFNGNISDWCVTTISTTPTNFANGANASFTVGRQPTWGSCPYPNV